MHIQVSPMTCVLGSLQAESGEAGYHFPCAELLSDGSVYICARKDRGMNDPYGRTEAVRYLPATGDLIPMPPQRPGTWKMTAARRHISAM